MVDRSFSAVIRLLRAQQALEARITRVLGTLHGLSLKELLMLLHIDRAPGRRLKRVDLSERLAMSQSSVTRMTLPLEKRGIVAREANPRDARVAYVVLTEAGRRLVEEAEPTLRQQAAQAFTDRWTRDEIAQLSSLLGRLTAHMPGDHELTRPPPVSD